MKNSLENFSIEKEKLLRQYEEILKHEDELLKFHFTGDDIRQKYENLRKEKFIISFCGQMKCGKSTLLNSYLFGDNILPVDDTTQTAKLTIIKYSENPSFEAVFYTNEEWDTVKKCFEMNKDSFEYQEFKEGVRIAEESGINLNEIFDRKRVDKVDDIRELTKYVATPKHGGVFSTFINYVVLYYPNRLLREATFVDTPGINDPNKVREDITLNWVKKSDAVIYLTYAMAAISDDDVSFIDNYLFGVANSNKIFVINKCDSASDMDSIKTWVDATRNDPQFAERKIFDNSSPLLYVCSLGELIRKKIESGQNLSEELTIYKEKLENGTVNFVKPENNNIAAMGNTIEDHLIKNKGESILSAHRTTVDSVFEAASRALDLENDKLNEEMKLLDKDVDELKKDLENLENQKANIEKMLGTVNHNESKMKSKLDDEMYKGVMDFKVRILKEIERKLRAISSIKLFRSEIPWAFKSTFENEMDALKKASIRLTNQYNELAEKESEPIIIELTKYRLFSKKILKKSFHLSSYDLMREISAKIGKEFTVEKVQGRISDLINWFRRFLNTKSSREEVVSDFRNEADKFLDKKILDSIYKNLRDQLIRNMEEFFNTLEGKTNSLLDEKEDTLKSVLNNQTEKEEKKQSLHTKVGENAEIMIKIDKIKNQILS